jgi:hypothetical protein
METSGVCRSASGLENKFLRRGRAAVLTLQTGESGAHLAAMNRVWFVAA